MKDDLGDRIKSNYENRSKTFLTRRIPVIIRADGKSFSNFCKRFKKPHDQFLHDCLNNVMLKICQEVQGAKFAERHSDEISILVTDYDKENTDAYFDYEVQKIVSVVAGIATAEFCRQLIRDKLGYPIVTPIIHNKINLEESWPIFDCRCFNLPIDEISNYFYWRMLDAKRNSINMLAQTKFSHKQLQGVTCDEMQEMLFQKHGINWAKLDQGQKTGYICLRKPEEYSIPNGPNKGTIVKRNKWNVDVSPANIGNLRDIISTVLCEK